MVSLHIYRSRKFGASIVILEIQFQGVILVKYYMEIFGMKAESVKIIDNQRQMRVLIYVKTALESYNIIKYNCSHDSSDVSPGRFHSCTINQALGIFG